MYVPRHFAETDCGELYAHLADRAGVIDGLRAAGDAASRAVADAMSASS